MTRGAKDQSGEHFPGGVQEEGKDPTEEPLGNLKKTLTKRGMKEK